MIALVVYDSAYGNTAKLADAMAAAVPGATARRFQDLNADDLARVGLLLVGSPTQGGQPTPALQQWLRNLPPNTLKGVRVSAFDTRIDAPGQKLPLRLLMSLIGYAAPKMAKSLGEKGGTVIGTPEGFFVEGREGPLRAGEAERATRWAAQLGQLSHSRSETAAARWP